MDRELDDLELLFTSLSLVDRQLMLMQARIMSRNKWRKYVEPSLAVATVAAVTLMITGHYEEGFIVGVIDGFVLGVYSVLRWLGIIQK